MWHKAGRQSIAPVRQFSITGMPTVGCA